MLPSEPVIGNLYKPGVHSYDAACVFDMYIDTCYLELFWYDITDQDIANITNGSAMFAMWYSNDGDIFFLFRFGDDPWADSVYSIMQTPEEQRRRPPYQSGKVRMPLKIVLVDAETGIVRAVRTTSLSSSFSRKLCISINRQFSQQYRTDWSEEAFIQRVKNVYLEYPQPADLVEATGCIICQSPTGEFFQPTNTIPPAPIPS